MAISISAEGDLRAERGGVSRPAGVARPCMTYAGELARERVVTPDDQDYIVTTAADIRAGSGFLTGAYPVSRGYLVMMRQPLVEFHSATEEEARERHAQLSSVLAEAGSRVVRARAALLARKRAETLEAKRIPASHLMADESLSVPVETAPVKETFASLN